MDNVIKSYAKTAFQAIQEIKAHDIIGLDLDGIESYADCILIASGGSDRQTRAIADNVIKQMFAVHHLHPLGTEGYTQGEWILIDFGDFVVHVFFVDTRKSYHLEDMWHTLEPMNEAALLKFFKSDEKPEKKLKAPKTKVGRLKKSEPKKSELKKSKPAATKKKAPAKRSKKIKGTSKN